MSIIILQPITTPKPHRGRQRQTGDEQLPLASRASGINIVAISKSMNCSILIVFLFSVHSSVAELYLCHLEYKAIDM